MKVMNRDAALCPEGMFLFLDEFVGGLDGCVSGFVEVLDLVKS